MKPDFVAPNNPILNQKAEPVKPSENIKNIIDHMLSLACGEQKDNQKPVMVGLAAPQIGILKRIILVDVKANGVGGVGDLRVYINPEIIWGSKEKVEWYEGCYSTSNVCGIVSRPTSIKIKTISVTLPMWNTEKVEEKYEGYVARIFQHEIDHLNGKRFPDLIQDPEKLHWVKKEEFPLYRDQQAWKNWPKKCSFEKWVEIKRNLGKNVIYNN